MTETRYGAEEWRVRVELAAIYRLVALYGWDDLIFTHISARVPGPEGHLLINPYGWRFGEITASSLVKIDAEGKIVEPDDRAINYAGFVIHGAIHGARPDAHFVIHLHTMDGVAVSAQKGGLLPLNQGAMSVLPRLAYHEYEGAALNLDERERLVANLGDHDLLILRNHGTLAIGRTAGEAWLGIYILERACTTQVRTLSAGHDRILIAPSAGQAEITKQVKEAAFDRALGGSVSELAWRASLRQIEKESPGYSI